MIRRFAIALCLSYIIGLLCISFNSFSSNGLQVLPFLMTAVVSMIAVYALGFLEYPTPLKLKAIASRIAIDYRLYLAAVLISWLAIVYLQLRLPQPKVNDISYQVTATRSDVVSVTGKVLSEPRLNDAQRLKFVFKAMTVKDSWGEPESVSGKLYATIPLLQGTGLHPGMKLNLAGVLYLPQAANRAGGFDFQKYLSRQGIFAGIQGFTASFKSDQSESGWGWWRLRQRIVRSHLRGLGSPVGQLVSSMVLGRKAVDLSAGLRDRFIEAGLAHVLAASGFHVSLLLGITLKLTSRLAAKPRLTIGIGTLIIYLGLTGIQASVFRACLMGLAVLIALTKETKVKPLGSLLLAATIILLFNPLFIQDLGFQLSFLATLGLIVTMPGLQKRLDWLPPTVATLVAVPLAASVWVLPLLSYGFNRVAVYSLAVNIICTPLIILVSLGGMVSAIGALILPALGSAIAWLLYYPALLLISIIKLFTSLPGSSWAVGQISLATLLIIYAVYILVWLNQWWRDRLALVCLFVLTLVIIPLAYQHFNLTQITVLPGKTAPILVVQDRGEVVLINSGDSKTVKYGLLPLIDDLGINQIDYAFDFDPQGKNNWQQLSDRLTIKNFANHPDLQHSFLPTNKKTLTQNIRREIATKSFKISFDPYLSLLRLETATANWLIFNHTQPNADLLAYIQINKLQRKSLVLVGNKAETAWQELQPQTIITLKKQNQLPQQNQYSLKQHGAIAWTPQTGITLLKTNDDSLP